MKPVITLAQSSFSRGEEVAARVAAELGWPLLANDVFAAAARIAGTDPGKILEAVREPPSFLGMSIGTRKHLLACLGAALTEAILPGGVVYRGPAGHHFIHGVSHVIRVKVTASLEDRATERARIEDESIARGRKDLVTGDKRRLRTCREVFGEDCDDPGSYDLLVSTTDKTVYEAADLVVSAARARRYQPQSFSNTTLRHLALAFRVRAALTRLDPDVLVHVEGERVSIRTRVAESPGDRTVSALRDLALSVPGVEEVVVEAPEDLFKGRGKLMR